MNLEQPTGDRTDQRIEPYAWYVLSLLVLVYILNFVDRQVLTILAPDLKKDLGIDDSDFGFLYGTAFGVFYALFGIPLGKLADRWVRVKLLASGLVLWSGMTALSGLSRNFGQLAAARVGVGVGEATAGPCAYSLISDYFPPRRRATALAIYSSGLYLGGGLSLFIGSAISGRWNAAYAAGRAPFGLVGWQVAFLAVGIPGLLLAAWVSTLREPLRGRFESKSDAIKPDVNTPMPWGPLFQDLGDIVPPFTLVGAARRGMPALFANLAGAAIIAAIAFTLIVLVGDPNQWIALGVGTYAVFSWAAALRARDLGSFAEIWKSPAFLGVTIGYGLIAFLAYANAAFAPLYIIQHFGADPTQVGFVVGGAAAVGGAAGVIGGGALADRLAGPGQDARRILVIIGGLITSLVPYYLSYTTSSLTVFYLLVFPTQALASAALGGSSGTIVNIVKPEVRGTATAAFLLGATMIGLALGPYSAGKMSTHLGDLGAGLLAIMVVAPVSLVALIIAYRNLSRREASRG
ncbi:MFS transporter [Novosphingobium tardum]|uniref:MFS transporter n=1 Tax=Novosphingobium tardum TaxID=1538021 RepID=A0ABV8RLD9_9SPHN